MFGAACFLGGGGGGGRFFCRFAWVLEVAGGGGADDDEAGVQLMEIRAIKTESRRLWQLLSFFE